MTKQVVREVEIFFVQALEAFDQAFKCSPTPFLHFHLMAFLDRNEKVGIIFDRSLETSTVILEEIVVDTRAAARYVRILYRSAVHVDEPAGSGFTGLEPRKAQRLIDTVGQPNGLEFLILGGCFTRAEGSEFDRSRSSRLRGCCARSELVPKLAGFSRRHCDTGGLFQVGLAADLVFRTSIWWNSEISVILEMGITRNNVNIVAWVTPMPVGGLRNDLQSAGLVQLTAIAFLDADAYRHVPLDACGLVSY